jgi:hypothetical protein
MEEERIWIIVMNGAPIRAFKEFKDAIAFRDKLQINLDAQNNDSTFIVGEATYTK